MAYIAPTFKQAKRIAWKRFKQHLHPPSYTGPALAKFNESELTITHLPTGCTIYLLGCDKNPDNIRGVGLWHAVVDEMKDISREFLTDVLRPCFSDTNGSCLFIGTPPREKGISYEYYSRGLRGAMDSQGNLFDDWISWNVTTADAGIVKLEELQKARAELDPDVFAREYEASFRTTIGKVVHGWSDENVQNVEYSPYHRLHLSCDFNIDPMCWVVGQRIDGKYHVIDEIALENTTTEKAAQYFAQKYPPDFIKSGLTINGDASGNQRRSEGGHNNETNYKILTNTFKAMGYYDFKRATRTKNPNVLDRVEAFNAKVCDANGTIHFVVNPRCKWVIHSMENLVWQEGAEKPTIDKPSDRDRKESRPKKYLLDMFDATSYWVEYYDPIRYTLDDKPTKHKPIGHII